MGSKNVFEKYYLRLAKEGIIKSLLCSLIISFTASIIPAIIAIINDRSWFLLALAIWTVPTFLFTVLFYKLVFRPTSKAIAQRVDRLGLDERLITMLELENDESYIALAQRQDARQKLSELNPKSIRLSIFKVPIVLASVAVIFGIALTALAAFFVEGAMAHSLPKGWVAPVTIPHKYVEVHYIPEYGGRIDGDREQIVVYGEDSATVIAVAESGFAFDSWSDGLRSPERTDFTVTEEITVYAIFAFVQPEPEGEPQPVDYKERNLIIDNKTYYRDVYPDYLKEEMAKLLEEDIPPELRKAIELYFQTIE